MYRSGTTAEDAAADLERSRILKPQDAYVAFMYGRQM